MLINELLLASTNPQKIKEFGEIFRLKNPAIKLHSLQGLKIAEPDEPYDNFLDNAIHKAKYYAQLTGMPALSDDSGLCINALDGFPNVETKRFATEAGGLVAAFKKLEEMLRMHPDKSAYFQAAIAIFDPVTEALITHEGRVDGDLIFTNDLGNGEAFDPIFQPLGYDQVLSKLGIAVKNEISHRARAMAGLLQKCA